MMLTKDGYDDMFAGPWSMRDHGDDDADDDADSWWCWVKKDMMICLPAHESYEDHGDDDADDDADSWWCWLKKDMMICLLAHE